LMITFAEPLMWNSKSASTEPVMALADSTGRKLTEHKRLPYTNCQGGAWETELLCIPKGGQGAQGQ
jgi:hypothetical protein